ncbi:hypothetical protein TRAPUB_8076 [Trametes pubescens]|uniref:Uncharacterized protein n=1 Tax=Trametes pubescens TaxID=154538 RepID=A0A1M2W6B9_TRAPU|nr:hypothetical protein TRAPUB_8076 [Trametes pubescens]
MAPATFAPSPMARFKRNSLSCPPAMTSPPKSCLKRNSFPSSPRPTFLDGPRSASPASAVFDTDTDASDSASGCGSQASSCPGTPPTTSRRPRAKSVSFCEDDDVRVFYPVTDPLHKVARKQVVRLFKACAEAMKIEPPPPSRHSYSGYSECVLEGDEEER